MTENIKKTIAFMKERFESVEEFRTNKYRYEHSLRVGKIGEKIAISEELDVEGLTIACLLHDIGYVECKTDEDYQLHGRLSEKITREFLKTLGYEEERIESICYGIRIHTEPEENIQREPTPFELSVQVADNIDRFDAYRLYEHLRWCKIETMSAKEIIELSSKRIDSLTKYLEFPCGTKTGIDMWQEVLNYQINYYTRLKAQMEQGMEYETIK